MLGFAASAFAADGGKEEAVAMVERGVEAVRTMGAEKAYAEFSPPGGERVDRDLYRAVFKLDGEEFIGERMELAKTKAGFWQHYEFTNPVSKKIEAETMYCEKLADTVICGGVHK